MAHEMGHNFGSPVSLIEKTVYTVKEYELSTNGTQTHLWTEIPGLEERFNFGLCGGTFLYFMGTVSAALPFHRRGSK